MTCHQCGCPIERVAFFPQIGQVKLCYCCVEMWLAVANSLYMVQRQDEWIEEQKKKRELIRGD